MLFQYSHIRHLSQYQIFWSIPGILYLCFWASLTNTEDWHACPYRAYFAKNVMKWVRKLGETLETIDMLSILNTGSQEKLELLIFRNLSTLPNSTHPQHWSVIGCSENGQSYVRRNIYSMLYHCTTKFPFWIHSFKKKL